MKKLLICCEHYWPSKGGVQEVVKQIAERLVLLGVDVTVATSMHSDRKSIESINGVLVMSFNVSGNSIFGLKGDFDAYRDYLQSQKFDTILIKAAQQWTFDAAVDLWKELDAKIYFIPCGFPGLNNPRYELYYKHMPLWLSGLDGLIFYSSVFQDVEFCKSHGLKNLYFVTNGVDEREFTNLPVCHFKADLGLGDSGVLFLSVGTIIASKGHWEAIDAYSMFHIEEPSVLVINGNVIPESKFRKILKSIFYMFNFRLPLSFKALLINLKSRGMKRVVIADYSRSDLLGMYRESDIFLFCSHSEYSPLVLFEAAASATPFISSSAGNAIEIANWTGCGKVIPLSEGVVDRDELSFQIEFLLRDKALLRSFGENGRKKILDGGFTWDKISKDYFNILFSSDVFK